MRAVVQRVTGAQVRVEGRTVSEIGPGLLVLLGVEKGDAKADVDYMANKLPNLRIFEDQEGKMNLSLLDERGEMLLVSQFTLLGDSRKGRRPSFTQAEAPEEADRLYLEVARAVQRQGVKVALGVFRANMRVSLVNDGPVTLVLDSRGLV